MKNRLQYEIVIKDAALLPGIVPPDEAYSAADVKGRFDEILNWARLKAYQGDAKTLTCILYCDKETMEMKELHLLYQL